MRKTKSANFIVWILTSIILRNPLQSLHPVLEDMCQSVERDLAQRLMNSRKQFLT
jgi:hypothetical protein